MLTACLRFQRFTNPNSGKYCVWGLEVMGKAAFWSRIGRSAVMAVAVCSALALGGCSTTRFDYPVFGMAGNSNAPTRVADNSAGSPAGNSIVTGSIPVPPKPIYPGDARSRAYASNTYPTQPPVRAYQRTANARAPYGSPSAGTRPYSPTANNESNGTNAGSMAYANTPAARAEQADLAAAERGSYQPTTRVSYTPRPQSPAPAYRYPVSNAVYSSAARPNPQPAAAPAPVRRGLFGRRRREAAQSRPAPTPVLATSRNASSRKASQPAPLHYTKAEVAALRGPGSKTIVVKPGDSLYLYSLRYHVSVEAIQAANQLNDIRLTAGQKIIIPARGSTLHPHSYIVQQGDNLNSIARSQHVSAKKLAEINHITNVRDIQVGQELLLPGGDTGQLAKAGPVSAPRPVPAPVRRPATAAPASHQTVARATPKPAPSATSNAPALTSDQALPQPGPMSGQRFRWPVTGRIISSFGTRADGSHNDGIDLAAPQGTPIKSAENGVVAYAGDELKGYGNLVLIRHANNWVSAYAHAEKLLVKRGQRVRRGQVIALVGATGDVNRPELHFELRKGARPVNPVDYLSSASADAD